MHDEYATDSIDRLLEEWRRERPDLDPSPIAVAGRIVMLAGLMLREAEKWLAPMGLTWEAFSLIVTLRRSGKPYEMRPTDILRQSLLTSGAITNRIDRVEELGLVKRRADPGDRRSQLVRLTKTGKKLADQSIARHLEAADEMLGALSNDERELLADLLSKLLGRMETRKGQDH